MPHISLQHAVVHVVLLGKTDRLAAQPLDVRPEIQVLPLNLLRLFHGDRMLLRWYVFLVRLPIICEKALYVQVCQFTHKLLARGVVTLADVEGQNLAAPAAVGVPRGGPSKPALALLALADPRPHLVDHHALIAARKTRLSLSLEPQAQDHDYGRRAHFQYSVGRPMPPYLQSHCRSWPSGRPCA